jgi:hypothetical protein
MKRLSTFCALSLLLITFSALSALAQITPSDDAYVNSAAPTVNYGAATTLSLSSAADTGFIRFDLTAVPAGYTGSSVAKATLKLYVNSVTTAGSFNVDYVTGTWAEQTIKYNLQPTIGTTIVAGVALTTASKGKYVEIDITPAVVEWLNNTQPNDGIALVANSPLVATFDSKENTAASHAPELDIVYAGIAGVETASGSGLMGGGTSGTLNLSLITSCAANQILQWSGTAWACANAKGTGTITGVTPGTDLTGGGTSGNVTLNLDTTNVPQLATANTFVGNQAVTGNLNVASSASQPVTVQSSNSFGTWLALGNTSSGGHTWNIISAGGGNAEGAGNLGITDLTDRSTIWLEGNTNVSGTLDANASNGPSDSAITAEGFSAFPGSGYLGGEGISAAGGAGDPVNGKEDGNGGVFVGGSASCCGDGIEAYQGSSAAGYFDGDVWVQGFLSKLSGSFKIDHPLDPANKYLYHSFVESPDMMNIYNGNVVTDSNGDAIVPLPDWFETLNRDFRYQLTVIGQFAQAIVTGEVANHEFSIKTDKPGVKVSWQVTGIRQDPWANAHRIPVEEEKNARERGHYIRPELYGAPEEASIAWARHPETMKRIKELREQQSLPHASTAKKLDPAAPITR